MVSQKVIKIIIGLIIILILSFIYFFYNKPYEQTYIISKGEMGNIMAINESNSKVEFSGTDISYILASINNVITNKGIIKIKEGIYIPSTSVTFTKNIKLKAEGNVVFSWSNSSGEFLFIFTGLEVGKSLITKNVKENTNIITLNKETMNNWNIMSGDLVLIYDNMIWNPIYPEWKTGELHKISSISKSSIWNNITITDGLINPYTVIEKGNVKLIRPITVEVNGITIEGPGNISICRGIYLRYNKNSVIRDGKFQKCGKEEIVIGDSYKVTVENNKIGDNIYNGFGYGVVVADTSAYTNITKNYFYNCRHCVTIGGIEELGQAREALVSFNTFDDNTGTQAVIDAHPIAESYYIYNNKIYSPPEQGAIVSGAKITKIKGNNIIGGLGIYSYKTTRSGFIIEIADNLLDNSRRIFNNENGNTTIYQIDIENNIIIGDTIWSIVSLYNATKFMISGNQFNSKNKGIGQWGIYVNNSQNGIISNNTINNSYYSGIYLNNVNNTNIYNNSVTDYNNYGDLGEKGILLKNSSNNTIANNVLKKSGDTGTYGIGEIGTSDFNELFDNNLREVGTINSNRIQIVGKNTKIRNNRV